MNFYDRIIDLANNQPCLRQKLLKFFENEIEHEAPCNSQICHIYIRDIPGIDDLPSDQKDNLLDWAGKTLINQGFTVSKANTSYGTLLQVSWEKN